MFDAPADTWFLWLGVATSSLVAFGMAAALPTAPAPAADRAVATVDAVATSQYQATGEFDPDARMAKLDTNRIALRNDDGTARATVAHGPVTPVRDGSALASVLDGSPPKRVFENASAFRAAAQTARTRKARWEPVDGPLVVRRVTWEGVDVTLVGI